MKDIKTVFKIVHIVYRFMRSFDSNELNFAKCVLKQISVIKSDVSPHMC